MRPVQAGVGATQTKRPARCGTPGDGPCGGNNKSNNGTGDQDNEAAAIPMNTKRGWASVIKGGQEGQM